MYPLDPEQLIIEYSLVSLVPPLLRVFHQKDANLKLPNKYRGEDRPLSTPSIDVTESTATIIIMSLGGNMKKLALLVLTLFVTPALVALEFHSERIKTMDVEILQQIISRNIRKLEAGEESPKPIVKQSLEILLARPDQGVASSALFDQLQGLAGSAEDFTVVLGSIVDDAVGSLKKKTKNKDELREQNTYVYILINMLNEIQKLKDKEGYKAVIERIRDADIEFSDSLVSHRLLNSMAEIENPSKFAQQILPKKKSWWKFW